MSEHKKARFGLRTLKKPLYQFFFHDRRKNFFLSCSILWSYPTLNHEETSRPISGLREKFRYIPTKKHPDPASTQG